MKMNHIDWIRQILAYAVVLCLLAINTGFRAQPALAGAPDWAYKVIIVLFEQPEERVCLHQSYKVDGVYNVIMPWPPDAEKLQPAALLPPGTGEMIVKSKATEQRFFAGNVQVDKVEPFTFTYEATELGPDKITMEVNVEYFFKGVKKSYILTEKRELNINVEECNYKVHGSADIGKVLNLMMPAPGWEYVGTYDIFGEVSVKEEGISGEGTATTSQVFIWTGEAPDAAGLTCVHEPPWEGTTEVEMDGDLAAFADAGTLNLQFHVGPMSINASEVQCVDSEGGYGGFPMPGTTMESFILPFGPVSADGGHTTGADGPFEMDLFVIPEVKS